MHFEDWKQKRLKYSSFLYSSDIDIPDIQKRPVSRPFSKCYYIFDYFILVLKFYRLFIGFYQLFIGFYQPFTFSQSFFRNDLPNNCPISLYTAHLFMYWSDPKPHSGFIHTPADQCSQCICYHIIQLHIPSLSDMLGDLNTAGAQKTHQNTLPSASKTLKQYRQEHTKRNEHNNILNKQRMHVKRASPCFEQNQAHALPAPRFSGQKSSLQYSEDIRNKKRQRYFIICAGFLMSLTI